MMKTEENTYTKILMNYNNRWCKEKHIEYRMLKRDGYTQKMLIEHFGEDIYYSGMYNRTSSIMPWLDFIKEIKITPEYTNYNLSKIQSNIYPNEFDYTIRFENNNIEYVITLFFYLIEGMETYNILLTTEKQWIEYEKKLVEIGNKGYITDDERNELVNIVEKETGFNQLYPVMKKVSYILSDVFEKRININIISLGETKNIVKINLYRNIIKNSFQNIREVGEKFDEVGNKYFIYIFN